MKMLSRRRQSMDYFSPATSSNRKWLDHLHHPTRWSLTTQSEEEDEENYDHHSRSRMSGSMGKSSEMLMMMAVLAGGERHRGSSFGSCGAWSMGSLMDRCPTTPSPICSPVSSLSCSPPSELGYHSQVSTADEPSFATPNQSSCIISNDDKRSASPVEIEEESREETKMDTRKSSNSPHDHTRMQAKQPPNNHSRMKKMREGEGSSKKRHSPKSKLKAIRYVRPVGRHFSCEPSDSLGMSNYDADDGRLPAVSEEQEEERGCIKTRHPTTSSRLSSGSSGEGSGYENSDIESVIEEHIESTAQSRTRPRRTTFAAETRRKQVADQLAALKEARTMKLMSKLRREEASIDEWEKKKTTKAKMDMKKFEMKVEKRWARALEKMQRRIRTTQEEAERRKVKQRAAAAKKIAKVAQAFEKTAVTTGKLHWCLFFL